MTWYVYWYRCSHSNLWVALAGVGYGIFSIAGGDEWINSQIDFSDEINIVDE
jgi:hypothetical protein